MSIEHIVTLAVLLSFLSLVLSILAHYCKSKHGGMIDRVFMWITLGGFVFALIVAIGGFFGSYG